MENMDATYTFYILDGRPTAMRFGFNGFTSELVGWKFFWLLDDDHFEAYKNEY